MNFITLRPDIYTETSIYLFRYVVVACTELPRPDKEGGNLDGSLGNESDPGAVRLWRLRDPWDDGSRKTDDSKWGGSKGRQDGGGGEEDGDGDLTVTDLADGRDGVYSLVGMDESANKGESKGESKSESKGDDDNVSAVTEEEVPIRRWRGNWRYGGYLGSR